MKLIHYFKIYLILPLLLIPAFLTIYNPNLSGDSKIELRRLQNLPPLPKNLNEIGDWPSLFDHFTTDRFPFRTKIIFHTSKILYNIGISISPDVLIGKDNWLFLKKSSNILKKHRGIEKMTESQLDQWIKKYEKRKLYLTNRGIKVFLIIIPNKYTVYSHKIPSQYFKIGKTATDQLITQLCEGNVSGVIDLRHFMQKNIYNEKLYDQYNTHWNDKGAYLAYKYIMNQIDPKGLIDIINDNDVNFVSKYKNGDLSKLIGNPDLKEKTLEVKFTSNYIIKGSDSKSRNLYMNKEWISESNKKRNPEVLILCDSFVKTYLYKYFEQTFSKSIFKHHKRLHFNKELIHKYNPDMVFYIIVERLIPFEL